MEMCCKISYTWKSMNQNKIWLKNTGRSFSIWRMRIWAKPKTDQKKRTFKVKNDFEK